MQRWTRRVGAAMAGALLALLLAACGREASPPEEGRRGQAGIWPAQLVERQALLAIMAVEANLGGMQDAGYRHWTAELAAHELVPLLNAAQQPLPGEPRLPGPQFTYVADRPSGPWQVVLRTEGEDLVVEAYAAYPGRPVASRTLPVAPY